MITGLNSELEKRLEAETGQKARYCHQCKKCSAGCPVAFAMDLLPHEVMRMIVYGQRDRLLGSSTIWLCASCDTCTTRCPNEIDIAGLMDGLRRTAIREGAAPAEPQVAAFHTSFLGGIKLTGKTNEPVLIGAYKALSHRFFDDLGLGAVMFAKGKIKLLPRAVRDRGAVRRIFRGSKGEARK
jgi:heterodisulfide reductase subunit C